MNASRAGRLWLRWVFANSLGELLGLGATFAIGTGIFAGLLAGPGVGPVILSAALMTATGALEGAMVGLAQWWVLRGPLPAIGRKSWVVATIVGAVIAWLCGSIPMTLASLSSEGGGGPMQEPPQALVLLMASGLGLVAGAVLSVAQLVVLRRNVHRAWRWLPANAIAWAVGMPMIFQGIDLAQRAGSLPGAVLIMAASIALAGAVVGGIHGVILLRFAAQSTVLRRPTTR